MDIIIGKVKSIIDAKNFTLEVTHTGNHNMSKYKDFETIHNLEYLLIRENDIVSCEVEFKDKENRINARPKFI